MMTYEQIVGALFSGSAGLNTPTGVFFSYPVPSKDRKGKLVDNFFLYSLNRKTGLPGMPQSHIGIYALSGGIAYQRPHEPSQEFYAKLGSSLLLQRTGGGQVSIRPTKPMTFDEKVALEDEYKRLYPKVREFAFSDQLSAPKQNTLKDFFHVQRRLFGSQLADYRRTAPEFYSWMIQKVAPKTSFLDLMQNRQARLYEAQEYLTMAADEEEQQLLLGLNDEEFDFWNSCGNNALRLILCGRKLKISLPQSAEAGSPALLAARSYDPNSAGRRSHEKRLEEVRQIARDLRAEYNLGFKPNLDDLAEQLGIRVEYVQLDPEVDGFVQLDCGGEVITINEKPKRNFQPRKRFTLAHEIGHVVIPWHTGTTACVTDNPSVTIDQKRMIDSQEQEANVFASELLIPSDWLAEQVRQSESLDVILETVRKKTGASVLACLYAMEQVLPEGQVICVTSSAMKGWKIFRGPGVPAWKSEKQAFVALEKGYEEAQSFEKGTYQIRHYRKENMAVTN